MKGEGSIMHDARRFMRYVLPGLTPLVLLLLALYVSGPDAVRVEIRGFLSNGLEAGVAGLVASGGLGFAFSAIYYWLFWRRPILAAVAPKYDGVMQKLTGRPYTPDADPYTRHRAEWVALNAWWWPNMGTRAKIASASQRVDSLLDVLHGLAATTVGCFLAAVAWVVLYVVKIDQRSWVFFPCFFSWCAIIGVFYWNARHTLRIVGELLLAMVKAIPDVDDLAQERQKPPSVSPPGSSPEPT